MALVPAALPATPTLTIFSALVAVTPMAPALTIEASAPAPDASKAMTSFEMAEATPTPPIPLDPAAASPPATLRMSMVFLASMVKAPEEVKAPCSPLEALAFICEAITPMTPATPLALAAAAAAP